MSYSSQRIIFIALIFIIAISPSLGRREKSEVKKDLRDLCSQTDRSKECWKIIKPELSKFHDTNPKTVADVILDLARAKGDEIHEQLNRLYEDSRDDDLKEKYLSCSKNYSDAIRNLNLRDLCSKTNASNECWAIIKPELSKFNDTDPRKVADAIIVLAKTKGEEIHEQLNGLYEGSRDDKLKHKYGSCSKNYNDAIRNLYFARRDIELNDYRNIPIQSDDTFEELDSCGLEFEKDSFDPAHIRDRNKDFGVYVQIVKAATDRLLKKN